MKNARRRRLSDGTEQQLYKPETEKQAVQETPLPKKWAIGAFLLSIVLSFILYGNSLHGKFVYDDSYFSQRKDLRDISSLMKVWTQPLLPDDLISGGGFYRPLWTATMALNFILFGTDTFSFHMVNILLYGLVIYMVFLVARRLSGDTPLAAAASLFFAFLPVHTEVVANVKSRDELLSALFILISWFVFLKAKHHTEKQKETLLTWVSALLFFLAILSKENVVFMPFFFFLVWIIDRKPRIKKLLGAAFPFIIAYIVYFILRLWALAGYAFTGDNAYFIMNQLQSVSIITRISTGFELVWLYIVKIFVPYNLSASYDYNVIPTIMQPFANSMSILGIVMVVIIFALATFRSVPRIIRISSLFFIFSYAVISKVFYAKGAIFGERLIFLSSVGVAIATGWLIVRLIRWHKIMGITLFSICLVIYSVIIIPRNEVWNDPTRFFKQMVVDAPKSVQARTAVARGYFYEGKLKQSYVQAMAGYDIYPYHPGLLNILGKLAYIEKKYVYAEHFFSEAIRYEPHNFEHHQFFALAVAKQGRFAEAMSHVKDEYQKRPDNNDLRFIMALCLYRTGKKQEALSDQYMWTKEVDRAGREKILKEY